MIADGRETDLCKPTAERAAAMLAISCIPVVARTNGGYSYPVWVGFGEYSKSRIVLHIVGTPGSWYLSDVCGHEKIIIDAGQGWECTNFAEVIGAVLEKFGLMA